MYEGVGVWNTQKTMVAAVEHNITEEVHADAVIRMLALRGLRGFIFTHALQHPGICSGCNACKAALEEHLENALRKLEEAHGPPGEPTEETPLMPPDNL